MSAGASSEFQKTALIEESELLECLRKIGKGLLASGSSVGVVENTLIGIARTYGKTCEIVALPNVLMIKLGNSVQGSVDFTVQQMTSLRLDQVSGLVELIDQVKQKLILPSGAIQRVDQILAKPHRFKPVAVLFGYILSCIGLTLLFRPELRAILITAGVGLIIGLIIIWFRRLPRFTLLLPVLAAVIVSALIFNLTELGFVYGSANLIIPPLIVFLPGAILTTGMIDLASMHILSGSSRLIYGGITLVLLFVGIAAGLNISGLPKLLVYTYEAVVFPWWAPILGTLLFGFGTFIRLSGANRDLLWMLLVLYIAMVGQSAGEYLFSPYFGAFVGATLMALSSELIARSPHRTPAMASQLLAFWFLVPGARGLLSVTSILSENIQSALVGLGEVLVLIIAIALGVLLGTLIVSPQKFVAETAQEVRS